MSYYNQGNHGQPHMPYHHADFQGNAGYGQYPPGQGQQPPSMAGNGPFPGMHTFHPDCLLGCMEHCPPPLEFPQFFHLHARPPLPNAPFFNYQENLSAPPLSPSLFQSPPFLNPLHRTEPMSNSGMQQPPGFGPPPNLQPAPGMAPPPGSQQQSGGGFGQNFRPANMPENFNVNAPVIRLGMSGQQNREQPVNSGTERKPMNADAVNPRRGTGLGYENRDQQRNHAPNITYPHPTTEEIMRTIFVGHITPAFGDDENMKKIVSCPGGLRQWIRALGSDLKPTRFGWAEYDSADSLACALEVLKNNVQIPAKDQLEGKAQETNGVENGDAHDEESRPKMDELLVTVDKKSLEYVEHWRSRGSLASPEDAQFRVDNAKEDLRQLLAEITNPRAKSEEVVNGVNGDGIGQIRTETRTDAVTGEVVTIPLTVEDELSDIPAEMREQVRKEIAAFRERANKNDMERLEREEKIEAQERARNARSSLTSTSATANNIPVGPRAQQAKPPTGPKTASDPHAPIPFTPGDHAYAGTPLDYVRGCPQEDEDDPASDEELERRREAARAAELERQYLEQERKWLIREKQKTTAFERERAREAAEAKQKQERAEAMRKRLAEFDDDVEAERQVEEYYIDRSLWVRNRANFRAEEARRDAIDRTNEERRLKSEQDQRTKAGSLADTFLAQQAAEVEAQPPTPSDPRANQQSVKINLGSALAKKSEQTATQQRRNMAAVEGLLDEEDDANKTQRRELIPLAEDATKNSGMSAEERAKGARQLAQEIPSDRRGLWAYDVKWDFLDGGVISDLRKFAEKRIVDYLGIQEQSLIEEVLGLVGNRGKPQDLVGLLKEVSFLRPSYVKPGWLT